MRSEYLNGKLDYFTSWAQNDVLSTPRRGTRRPSLHHSRIGGISAPAPKTGGLKRSNEVRSQALPTLNLAKIKQNLEQQQQLEEQEFCKDELMEGTGTQSTPASSRGDRTRSYLLKRSAKESSPYSSDYAELHNSSKGSETARGAGDNREKLAKYTYPYSVAQLMSNMNNERKFNGDSYAVRSGSLTTRNHAVNPDREPSESRMSGISDAENASSKSRKPGDSTLQAKKLSLRLVSSLEEALAKVSKPDWEAKKLSLQLTKDPFSVTSRTNQHDNSYSSKFHGNLHHLNLKDDQKSYEDGALKMADNFRLQDEMLSSPMKEGAATPRVKPLKLPVDSNSTAVPLVRNSRIWW